MIWLVAPSSTWFLGWLDGQDSRRHPFGIGLGLGLKPYRIWRLKK